MESGHRLLEKKLVNKLKRDVNGNIAQFKGKLVVKDYFQQYKVDFEKIYVILIKPMVF